MKSKVFKKLENGKSYYTIGKNIFIILKNPQLLIKITIKIIKKQKDL